MPHTPTTIKAALDAAVAFIESHVADPDITPKMRETYAAYQKAMAELNAPAVE
jgi:cephalosporin hydroxylase